MKAWSFAPSLCVILSCSGAHAPGGTGTATDPSVDPTPVTDVDAAAAPGTAIEHGVIVDYETGSPVKGLTVTDNGLSTITDAKGAWSLAVPADALLQPTVSGPNYSQVLYPDSTSSGDDVDFATALMPDHSTFLLEQQVLSFDPSLSVVHVVVRATGACASVAGGTLRVLSPQGASIVYFGTSGIPQRFLTSFQAMTIDRPVAVVYNVQPGSDLQLAVDHPSCTMVPYPATYGGKTYSGHVRTVAAQPGDNNTAMVVLMQ